MQTKLNDLTTTRYNGATTGRAVSSAPSPYIDDNFLLHLAPVSIGVFFFGNFHPNTEDKVQAHRALYKTSFLYRHFLQPGGLKAVIDENYLTLTGKISSSTVSLMAQLLGSQIMGVVKVVDETTRQEEVSRTGKVESIDDTELRARLQLMLATDAMLGSEEIEIAVSHGNAKITGHVRSAEHKAWAETLLHSVVPQAKISVQVASHKGASIAPKALSIDDDSLQALALTRLKLVPALAKLDMRAASQRQALSLSGVVSSAAEKNLAESIAKRTYGLREFKSSVAARG